MRARTRGCAIPRWRAAPDRLPFGAIARPETSVRTLPWPLLRLAGLLGETPREIHARRYLRREPVRLDNRKPLAFGGTEPHTPLADAVASTLRAMNVT